MKTTKLLFLSSVLSILSACFAGAPTPAQLDPCGLENDSTGCAPGTVCENAVCVEICDHSSDCDSPIEACVNGYCAP